MNFKIKICGMRDAENIRQVLAYQPDLLGFIFYPKSSRYVDQDRLEKINAIDFGSTEKVGVFVNEDPQTIISVANRYQFNYIQLHGDETDETIQFLQKQGLQVIKVISMATSADLEMIHYYPSADYLLFDTKGRKLGGNGYKFDWRLLENIVTDQPIFLSGGLGVDDLKIVQENNRLKLSGLDFNSQLEEKPALKDIAKVKQLMNQINQEA